METGLITKESIKVIGQSSGLELSDEVALLLAHDTEVLLLKILQESEKFMKRSKRNNLTVEDINLSLKLKNFEQMYGHSGEKVSRFKKVSGYKGFYFVEDQEKDISQILNYELPPCPIKTTYDLHWLAIDGIQPSIPQNQPKFKKVARRDSAIKEETDNIITEEVEVKPNSKHILSKELQMYYDKITKSLLSNESETIQTCLEFIKSDPVIQHLLPYICLFIKKQLRENITNMNIITMIIQFIESIFNNMNIFIDNYLHYFLPVILTCIVYQHSPEDTSTDHWAIRRRASDLLMILCNRFGKEYKNIRPRVIKTLVHSLLDFNMPLSTHYGCIVGICKIEKNPSLILPHIEIYCKYLNSCIEQNEDQTKKMDALKVMEALKEYKAI